MKFQSSQRRFIANKMMDSANVALAGLVFGQLVTDRVQPLLLLLGSLIYLGGWSLSIHLRREVRD